MSPSPHRRPVSQVGFAALVLLVSAEACGSPDTTASGPRFEIRVAPFGLGALDEVCWDLSVESAAGIFWSRGDPATTRAGGDQNPLDGLSPAGPDTQTICSSRYGSGSAGEITFIGACDTEGDTAPGTPGIQNRVRIYVDGLYQTGVTPGGVAAPERVGWADPCPNGCVIEANCEENTSTLVSIDMTLMRKLADSFIAAATPNADKVFCSASFSTCDGADPNLLLTGLDEQPDPTGVLAVSCQLGSNAPTPVLFFDTPLLTCDDGDPGTDDTLEIALTCGGGVAGATQPSRQLEYLITNDSFPAGCGDPPLPRCESIEGGLSVNLTTLAPGRPCRLKVSGTVTEAGIFVDGMPPPETSVFPYFTIDVPVTSPTGEVICQEHGLDLPGSSLVTEYRGPITPVAIAPMCISYEPGDLTMAESGGAGCASPACEPFIRESCNDGVRNGLESDVDCGGACSPCVTSSPCVVNSDCASGNCVLDTLTCAPLAVPDIVTPVGPIGSVSVTADGARTWTDGTFAPDCAGYRTGDATHRFAGQVGSGRYRIQPDPSAGAFDVYCDMTTDGGGWTLVLKADGNSPVFGYDSPHWTTPTTYEAEAILPDERESKSPAFNSVPFSEVRLGMAQAGGSTNWLQIATGSRASMRSVFASEALLPLGPGWGGWKTLLPGASLQGFCQRQGFNVRCDIGTAVRIGIVGNNEDDCNSCDSRFGFGGAGGAGGMDGSNTCGNEARWGGDAGEVSARTMGYVFVRRSVVVNLVQNPVTGARSWSNGALAMSCKDYRNGVGGLYQGATGDGVYRIMSLTAGPTNVYCDQSSDGGGWALVAYWTGGSEERTFNDLSVAGGTMNPFSSSPAAFPALPAGTVNTFTEQLVKNGNGAWGGMYGAWIKYAMFAPGFVLGASGFEVTRAIGGTASVFARQAGWWVNASGGDPFGLMTTWGPDGLCGGSNTCGQPACPTLGAVYPCHYDWSSPKSVYVR